MSSPFIPRTNCWHPVKIKHRTATRANYHLYRVANKLALWKTNLDAAICVTLSNQPSQSASLHYKTVFQIFVLTVPVYPLTSDSALTWLLSQEYVLVHVPSRLSTVSPGIFHWLFHLWCCHNVYSLSGTWSLTAERTSPTA